jgi:exo-1,4-beta-D-glucosaminidase
MYSYANNEVDITNSLLEKFSGLKAEATIYNLDGSKKFTKTITTDVDADGVQKCFALPPAAGFSDAYFLRLQLNDAKGEVTSINWYWLSKKGDILNWKKSKWYMTPEKSYTDYSTLQNLGKTALKVSYKSDKGADTTSHTVTITNTGKTVAFQVHLRALKGKNGDDILPVIFSDNYFSLAPGESRVINCSYARKDASDNDPYFLTSAWNLDTIQCKGEKESGFENSLAVK